MYCSLTISNLQKPNPTKVSQETRSWAPFEMLQPSQSRQVKSCPVEPSYEHLFAAVVWLLQLCFWKSLSLVLTSSIMNSIKTGLCQTFSTGSKQRKMKTVITWTNNSFEKVVK